MTDRPQMAYPADRNRERLLRLECLKLACEEVPQSPERGPKIIIRAAEAFAAFVIDGEVRDVVTPGDQP